MRLTVHCYNPFKVYDDEDDEDDLEGDFDYSRFNPNYDGHHRPQSEAARYKLWWANIGKKASPETRQRQAEVHRGITKSVRHKQKIAASMRGKNTGPQSPEHIAKRVASFRITIAKRKITNDSSV